MKLQDVIRIRRKELGLTLEEIAKFCGVGKSIVAKWERGEVDNLKRSNLASLADVLNVSPLVLMGREELYNIKPSDPLAAVIDSPTSILSKLEGKLLENFRQLNEEGQEKVLSYVNDLIQTGIYKNDNEPGMVQKKA